MRIRFLVAANLALVLAMSLASEQFRTSANLVVLVDNLAVEAIALAVIALLLIGGLFDLSFDGVAALAGVAAGQLMMGGGSPLLAIALGLGIGGVFGAANGLAVNHLRLNPLMVTLATWWIAVGLTLGISGGLVPYGFPDWFLALGQTRVLGLRVFVYYAAIVVALASLLLHYTVWGRHVFAIGGDRRAAVLCGVSANRVGLQLYLACGLAAAFIGLVMAARLDSAGVLAIDGTVLRVIAAAVIGGCSLAGGRGSILAGVLGLVLMALLSNASLLLHVSPYWQKALIGGILLVAILSERVGRKAQNGG